MSEPINPSVPPSGGDLVSAPLRGNFAAAAAAIAALEAAVAQRPTTAQVAGLAPVQAIVAGPNITVSQDGGVVTVSGAGEGEGGQFDHGQLSNRGASDAHPVEAITDLVAALGAKAATVHGHGVADITGLQSALDAKATPAQAAAAAPVQSVAGRSGAVSLAKADVGLASVDNTADSAKPVSAAQQTALNAKVSIHAHNTQAGLAVAVVSTLPASPAPGVLYIVTSGV
ncbi:hypothetical protein [Thiocapsa sp. UBA6158]|jgi:hypothetical protein|uniref:hypothetical protein n=1 Tax=Thiocapsa sp. UBA6158 TaxID=1947692 RepID=UPI0025E97C53|nr:hypothetical protein [Thiocapsa sp. UBA6158]